MAKSRDLRDKSLMTFERRKDRARQGFFGLALVALPLTLASLAEGPHGASPLGEAESSPAPAPASALPPAPECRLPALQRADPFPCAAALLVESTTGAVLYEQAADSSRAPASLAKMMLEVLVLEDLRAGRASATDSVLVREGAATMGGATAEILPGQHVPLGDLLEAVVLISANDAAVAIAEHLAGTEPAFVARMNARAAELGCAATRFVNCHGLDMPPEESRSTARDLARIARRLLELPESLHLASIREAPFRGGPLVLKSTNELLGVVKGVDGLKTGLTAKAGGCFCGTVERNGVRFVSVVLGASPGTPRFEITTELFEAVYANAPRWVDSAVPPVLLAGVPETR